MKMCIVRKVPFRLAGTKRLVWSLILAEREGLTLLFVRKPDDNRSHTLVIATENVPERVYEAVNVSSFPLEQNDMAEVASKLCALGSDMADDDIMKFLESKDLL